MESDSLDFNNSISAVTNKLVTLSNLLNPSILLPRLKTELTSSLTYSTRSLSHLSSTNSILLVVLTKILGVTLNSSLFLKPHIQST